MGNYIQYKGKGEHSVHELEKIIEQREQELHLIKSGQRKTAMEWWNNISSLGKTHICDTNTDYLGVARRHETLTGKEIEKLHSWRTIYRDKK